MSTNLEPDPFMKQYSVLAWLVKTPGVKKSRRRAETFGFARWYVV